MTHTFTRVTHRDEFGDATIVTYPSNTMHEYAIWGVPKGAVIQKTQRKG